MASRPRIVCVDNRREALVVRKMLLEQFGCDVVIAFDAQEGLQAVTEQGVDLAILDYHMGPGLQGDELAREIRASRPNVPLIMLTGDPMISDEAKATVDEVIIKGVSSPSDLLATIQKLLPEANIRQPRSSFTTES